jgi:DNA-binding GntR family transcriptional regulator
LFSSNITRVKFEISQKLIELIDQNKLQVDEKMSSEHFISYKFNPNGP